MNRNETMLGNFILSGPPEVRYAFEDLIAERNRLSAEVTTLSIQGMESEGRFHDEQDTKAVLGNASPSDLGDLDIFIREQGPDFAALVKIRAVEGDLEQQRARAERAEAEQARLEQQREIIDQALRGAVGARDQLRKVVSGAMLAIESILTDDHVDLGVPANTILGRVSAALREQISYTPPSERIPAEREASDEPEVQHLHECEHPIASCTCPRDHLLSEARRIRGMCLFAETEFGRENRRAVDLKIERDGWRSENDRHRALYVEAVKERDRLRAVIVTVLDGLAGPESEDAVAALTSGHVNALKTAMRPTGEDT